MDTKTLEAVINKLNERVDYCQEMADWCKLGGDKKRTIQWVKSKYEALGAVCTVEDMLEK